MEEWTLFLRVFLGTIFLSTGISKVRNMQEHILIVKEYRILPSSQIYIVARVEVLIELFTGMMLFLGLFQTIGAVLASLLLILYSLAITINLIRGRNGISCGCGGAVGSHQISWFLVLRNLTLMTLAGWVYFNPAKWGSIENLWQGDSSDFFHLLVIQNILMAWLALLFFMMINGIWRIHTKVRPFLRD